MGRPILTPQEMRAAEEALFSSGTDSFDLMQRAGNAVAEFVHAQWPEGRIQILCGPGGNGGDGFIAAAKLAKLWRDVEVFCLVDKQSLKGDAAKAAAEWEGEIKPLNAALEAPHDIVLDALFGGGLSRPLEGVPAKLAERGGRVVSIDVPSGIHGESAKPLGVCFRAEGTITFAALRPAHVLFPGAAYCGGIFVADIGVPVQSKLLENSPILWGRNLPQPGQGSHKHARGHLAVVSGNVASTGAARLASRAGLRAGAGLVTLLSPPDAVAVNASHLTAVMLKEVSDAEQLRESIESASTVILGPAAGITTGTKKNVECLLSSKSKAVLDADALTVFADDKDGFYRQLRSDDLITPHIGEFNRLFGDLLDSEVNKVEATRKASRMTGCVVLLKGPDTVIAKPDGMAIVNTHATHWLATAGSGDVLAGIAGGLMAQGVDTFTAAAMASWLHGEAGRRVGAGLIAEDLESELPDILSALHGEQQ